MSPGGVAIDDDEAVSARGLKGMSIQLAGL